MSETSLHGRWLALVLLVTAGSAQAGALSDKFYLGLRGGISQSGINDAAVGAEINRRGHNITLVTDDNSPSGVLYAGYWLAPRAAVELGYIHLGSFDTRITGTSSNPSRLATDIADVLPALGGNGVTLALRYDQPLFGPVSFVPRLGLVWSTVERKIGGVTRKDSGVSGMAGAGLNLRVGSGFQVGLGFDLLPIDTDAAQTQLYGDIEYRF